MVPSLEIGGAGGGGSGVSVTGTVNNAASVLPRLTPGAAGGSGGGSLLVETARDLLVGPAARLLADGGRGGEIFDPQATYAGGGGGGGGNVTVRAGRMLTIFQGALLSVLGGEGGGIPGAGKGGQGGPGILRLEDFDDTLSPATFAGVTFPPVTGENVGRMLGLPQGVGQSLFYQAKVVNPENTSISVKYVADTDGDEQPEPLEWDLDETGASGGPEGFLDPPFRISFNSAPANDKGLFDDTLVVPTFYHPSDLLSARAGLAWDATGGVFLFAVGEGCTQVHRLDPATLSPVGGGPDKILLPTIPSNGTAQLDLLALAVDTVHDEIFLFERDTARVHVISRATGAYLRQVTLPFDPGGAMAYRASTDRLLFADNDKDRIVGFVPRDATAGSPATTNWAPKQPSTSWQVERDGLPLDIQLVGLAVDAATPSLWCTDAASGSLFQLSLAPGFEGTATTGVERYSKLVSGADGVIPSALAHDGANLALVHATDPDDGRVRKVAPSSVSLVDADLDLPDFGTLLPEKARAKGDGDLFLRFRVVIDGVHDAGGTSFRQVRIDSVEVVYENKAF